ncbi:type II toxin-antitoxin system RelE/ParE family toxin [Endozoicomonas sp. 4G]|uniref:type II toxin-antitoxin system RelE/ParE family toxin n=1 Tax=Endozoicomonas sp. 4G TaxID=2872754 RepID=UPI0020785F4C|nr:type II toxin-antitoxin system RelE/ParE family toxin [Endozoicomonas sp. 4G]
MKIISVRFYANVSGHEPVREWLRELDRDDRRVIGQDVKTVELGWPLGMPLVKKMDVSLWEVRSDLPKGRIARMLFTVAGSEMVLLHGFIKKSRKISSGDLNLAKSRLKDVFRKQGGVS